MKYRSRFFRALLASASASVIIATLPALAAAPAASQKAEDIEEVVVTGSQVVTNGNAAPTPVTVISATQLEDSAPASIADALNKLPQFSGSTGFLNSAPPLLGGSGGSASAQGNYLNLRGFGANRTLVLLDGRRAPATNNDGSVDVDTLPQTLISRVDVVTGGASAAYGSDAITGVVNYVLDKKFNGVKASVQGGLSNWGDDGSQRYTFTAGHGFVDDRLHIEGAYEYASSSGIWKDNMRPLGVDNGVMQLGQGTAANPYIVGIGISALVNSPQGMIRSGPLTGYIFNNNGTISKVVPGFQNTATGVNYGYGASGGESYRAGDFKTLVSPNHSNRAFGRISLDVGDHFTAYAQGNYGGSNSHYMAISAFTNAPGPAGIQIFPDNAYLSPALVTQIFGPNPNPNSSFTIARFDGDLPGYVGSLKTTSWNSAVGVDANFGSWTANLNWSHAQSTLLATETDPLLRNMAAAMEAVVNPANGQVVCRVSLGQYASLYPGCAPFNPFGTDPNRPGAPSVANISFMYNPIFYYDIHNQIEILSTSAHGDLFEAPAGMIRMAAGVEYRHQRMTQVTDAGPDSLTQDLGLRSINPTTNPTVYVQDSAANAKGRVTVKEAFAEFAVPLLRDVPAFQATDLDVAGRITDYSTSGTVKTWKVGLTNTVNDQLRLRGTYSRDIKAPSLYQLFQQPSNSTGGFLDPQTGIQGSTLTKNGGTPTLVPENALTFSAGFVYTPEFFEGFSLTADYYDINMKNAISSESTADEVRDCIASNYTAAICSAINRPLGPSNTTPANFPTSITVQLQNFAVKTQTGLDVEVGYKYPNEIYGGTLSARLLANFIFEALAQTSPTAALTDYAGYLNGPPLPKVKGSLTLTYANGPLTASLTNRMTGSVKPSPTQVYVGFDLPNYVYTDLSVTYNMNVGDWDVQPFMSISNLLNTQPHFVPTITNPDEAFPTNRSMYDVVGRYYTLGVRVKY